MLIVVPVVVLGAAIEWPASLDDPTEVALPRFLANEGAVRFGYIAYRAYRVLFLPVAVAVTRWLHRETRLSSATTIAIGMAAASSALRAIGIVRWLSTMFPLAEQYEQAKTASARESMSIQFETLNG